MNRIEGGCLCGAVRYEITQSPMGAGACHCRACQYASGGGPNYVALIPKNGFKVTRGAPKRFTRPGGSGADVTRVFCGECGTPLWSEGAMPFLPVKVGGFDDPSALEPGIHLWTSAAPPWHPIGPGRPTFPENPPMS
ncbi:MAG: GFA family protein [Caulobacter sp.]|nr:GFA family protein [Caulobacter sp.]